VKTILKDNVLLLITVNNNNAFC